MWIKRKAHNQRNESTEGVDFGKLKMHSCMYIHFVFHHFSENNLWKAYSLPNIKQQPCMALVINHLHPRLLTFVRNNFFLNSPKLNNYLFFYCLLISVSFYLFSLHTYTLNYINILHDVHEKIMHIG